MCEIRDFLNKIKKNTLILLCGTGYSMSMDKACSGCIKKIGKFVPCINDNLIIIRFPNGKIGEQRYTENESLEDGFYRYFKTSYSVVKINGKNYV